VKISDGAWIGDDVYLENEYPENIEIHKDAVISMRSTMIAHTSGAGKIIVEQGAFIGPGSIVVCSEGRAIRIGQGSVLGPGCIITSSVAPRSFVVHPKCHTVAWATAPLTGVSAKEVMAGLEPIKRRADSSSE
jgi:acetyltransferase-like isoleucine patch superfamily enzyme